MAIIGFDQDPEAPPGAGMFHFDDRPSIPAYSPQHAAPFMAPQADERLAFGGGGGEPNPGMGGAGGMAGPGSFGGGGITPDQVRPQAPPIASDVAPSMSMPPPAASSAAAPAMSAAPEMSERPPAAPEGPLESQDASKPAPTQAQPKPQQRAPQVTGQAAPTTKQQDESLPPALRGIPKGMQLASETKTAEGGTRRITPEEQTARSEAFLNEALTEQRVASESAAWEAKQAVAAQKQADEWRKEAAERQAQQDRIRSEYRAKRASIQEEVDQAAQRKVDPNHYYDTHNGTFTRIMFALSKALGAFGATLGRTPNYAQEMIDKEIDRDIALQREEIAEKGHAAKNKLATLMRDYDLDIGEASGILKNSQQQLADSQARAFAHATRSKEISDNFDKWYAARAAKRVDEDIAREDQTVGKVSTKVELKRAETGGAGGGQLDKWAQSLGYPTYKAMVADDAARKQADPNHTWADTIREQKAALAGKAAPGTPGAAAGGRGSAKIFEQAGVAERVIDQIDELNELYKHPSNALSPEQRSRMKQLQADITISYARARHGGAPTEVEIAHPPVSGTTDILGGDRQRLSVMRANMVKTKEHAEKGLTMGLGAAAAESAEEDDTENERGGR